MSILKMFFLVVLQILAFSAPSGAQESFPFLDVSDIYNTLGLTQSISIECRAKADLSVTIATILSISIVHFHDESSFTEIASVSSFAGLWKNNDYGETIAAAGMIDIIGVSYVNITLNNPKQENAGMYSCDLIGLNREGKITNFSSSRKVDFFSPTIENALQQIENYKNTIDSMISNYINSMSTAVSQLHTEVKLLHNKSQADSNKLSFLEGQIKNVTKAVRNSEEEFLNKANTSKYEYFDASDYFNGRRYWLSKKAIDFSARYAHIICVSYGGYLAEIDTQDELQFLKAFVYSRAHPYWMIYVGGTDEDQEGLWINRYSKTAVASLWERREPNNANDNENCQALPGNTFWNPFDISCLYPNRIDVGFLCEIPE